MTTQGATPALRPERGPIPVNAGIGRRPAHYRDFLDARPAVGFVEVHSENYMGAGGVPLCCLEQVRRDYPVSLHGVALSLGTAGAVDPDHLARLTALVGRFDPFLVSEHLSWSGVGGVYLDDLLPLPYDEETLVNVAANVARTQDALGRRVLIENPSAYLRFHGEGLAEPEFLGELAARTGCGILLDVNNIAVSGFNLGFDGLAYLDALPTGAIGEIHLAGHAVNDVGERRMRIDDHGSAVCDEVWGLFAAALRRFGTAPTLIEWDSNLPPLDVLVGEAAKADAMADTDPGEEAREPAA